MDINSKIDQAKGRAEQAAGDATDNEELKDRGEQHETEGKLKGKISELSDKAEAAVDKIQEKLDHKK